MPYRRTENVSRKLAARQTAIVAAARALAEEEGFAGVQIAAVAARAGIAAGTVYRYFPGKTELIAALIAAHTAAEVAALERAGNAAPGPLSALAATLATFATRMLAGRRLAFAMIAEPVEPALDAVRLTYRGALVRQFEMRVRAALDRGYLPAQDAPISAAALVGALTEGLIGPGASLPPADPDKVRPRAQSLTLFALRGLGILDARARGLVVQSEWAPLAASRP
jgi:AcrR family transcriptional regulator